MRLDEDEGILAAECGILLGILFMLVQCSFVLMLPEFVFNLTWVALLAVDGRCLSNYNSDRSNINRAARRGHTLEYHIKIFRTQIFV